MLRLFVQDGMDVNTPVACPDFHPACRITLLHWMYTRGAREAISVLMHAGADVNAFSDSLVLGGHDPPHSFCMRRQTPLMYAAERGWCRHVRDLLKRGACIRVRDHFGDTALSYGMVSYPDLVVPELLAAGATLAGVHGSATAHSVSCAPWRVCVPCREPGCGAYFPPAEAEVHSTYYCPAPSVTAMLAALSAGRIPGDVLRHIAAYVSCATWRVECVLMTEQN